MPEPSAIFDIVRTGAEALCIAMGPRKAKRFLCEWARIVAAEDSVSPLFPVRTSTQMTADAAAHLEAMTWLRKELPLLKSRVPLA